MDRIDQDIYIFENDIEFYFNEFCEKYDIDDMSQETQNRFNGCMMYIGKYLFRNTDKLKVKPNINNQYDISKLNVLFNIYIELCTVYSKEVSINGFSKLSCIEYQTFLDWGKNPSCAGFGIYKKLLQENENSNSDLLSSGKNPVGIMARLNHVHGWSAQQIKREVEARNEALTLDQLPALQDVKSDVLSLPDGQSKKSGQE